MSTTLERSIGTNTWNGATDAYRGFVYIEAKSVAARPHVCLCTSLKATKLGPQCDGLRGCLVDE